MVAGNNVQSQKFRTIVIPLVRDNDLSGVITGRYNFPENPELEKKNIVGIAVAFGGDNIPIQSPDNFQGSSILNIGTWTGFANSSFITLYNQRNEEVVYNMPLVQLWNQYGTREKKILPFATKLNIRKSFVYLPASAPAVPGFVLAVNLIFFYN